MSEFDPVKACREQLMGLHDVKHALIRVKQIEIAKLESADATLNALNKLGGFVEIAIEEKSKELIALQEKQNANPR